MTPAKTWANQAHALDGGSPSRFQIEHHLPAASDEHGSP